MKGRTKFPPAYLLAVKLLNTMKVSGISLITDFIGNRPITSCCSSNGSPCILSGSRLSSCIITRNKRYGFNSNQIVSCTTTRRTIRRDTNGTEFSNSTSCLVIISSSCITIKYCNTRTASDNNTNSNNISTTYNNCTSTSTSSSSSDY